MTSTLSVRDELSSSRSNYRWGLQVLSRATSAHPYRRIPLQGVPRAQRFQASRLREIDGTFSQKLTPCTLRVRDELSSSRSSYWWGWRWTIPVQFYRKPIKPFAAEVTTYWHFIREPSLRWREKGGGLQFSTVQWLIGARVGHEESTILFVPASCSPRGGTGRARETTL